MNRLYYLLLTALITCPAAQALDIKTDTSYKKLVTAIEQAQKLEKYQAAWQSIAIATTAQDQTAVLDRALQLAHKQRTILQQELTNLGDQTKNQSNIKWGVGQLAFGTYLWLGELSLLIGAVIMQYRLNDLPGAYVLLPELWAAKKSYITDNTFGAVLLSRLFLINPTLGSYCLYKGYHNLKQGLNYKQFLQDKISNLDVIISYLQSLQH